MNKTSQSERALRLKALHERPGAFVIPNPWDVGSARLLAGLGFEALATTSAGFAHSLGGGDGMVTLQQKLDHIDRLSSAVDLPVSADLENGFSDDPREVAGTILKAAEAGAVGGSIEDHTRAPDHRIYDLELAVERIHAAVEAARSLDFPFMLTARAEGLLGSRMDLDGVIRRLRAFETAGADVLYAPGLKTLADVQEVAASLTRPLNVLGYMVGGATHAQLAEAGAKRISVGPALSRIAIAALLSAITEIREKGSFSWAEDVPSGAQVAALMEQGAPHRDKA